MHRYAYRNLVALALGVLLFTTACSDTTGPGVGQASVVLTGDVAANVVGEGISLSLGDVPETAVGNLFLTITRIDLHLVGVDDEGAEGEGTGGEGEASGSQSGWISLDPALVAPLDILTLSTAGVQIADGTVTAGRYNQVRFFFDTSELVLTEAIDVNGTIVDPGTYDVNIPSAAQSGLKLNLSNVEVGDGETETVAIELGLGATIGNLIWNANGFQLNPVLRIN